MASSSSSSSSASVPRIPCLLDLPQEIQKEIFRHCSQSDLICLALVSKAFRELAASQLYRTFHIVFPDDDDPASDSPVDGLAGGLDTFASSSYDYAQHLRDLSMDTLSAGEKAEAAYRPYLFNVSCGKFLNTLLLLTLRKAKSLDTFRWNIRVELSRQVYKALHDIASLKHLQIRAQAGQSLYMSPPPLPLGLISVYQDLSETVSPTVAAVAATVSVSLNAAAQGAALVATLPKHVIKDQANKKPDTGKERNREPATLGGFTNLESLAVLDMDGLAMVDDIKSCITNCSSKLRKLKLSFSHGLAQQSRPNLDPESNESDDDDDFPVVPVVPGVASLPVEGSGLTRAYRAQEERKNQEAVLGRIFDVEPMVVKWAQAKEKGKKDGSPISDSAKEVIEVIKRIAEQSDGRPLSTLSSKQAHKLLEPALKAMAKWKEAENVKESSDARDQDKGKQVAMDTGDGAPGFPSQSGDAQVLQPRENDDDNDDDDDDNLFQAKAPNPKVKEIERDLDPEDIDVAAPEEQLEDQDQSQPATKTEASSKVMAGTPSINPAAQDAAIRREKVMVLLHGNSTNGNLTNGESSRTQKSPVTGSDTVSDSSIFGNSIPQSRETWAGAEQTTKASQHHINLVEAAIDDAYVSRAINTLDEKDYNNNNNNNNNNTDEDYDIQEDMAKYARSSRGLALESLKIYLIPVKASILGRSVDVWRLKKLTLLNVGNQTPIWSFLAKENRQAPLPLCKIFTDHVTPALLQFLSQLDRVESLFLLQRTAKYRPATFAPSIRVTTAHIRHMVLKKHMATLTHFMLKNEADATWDVDEKMTRFICTHGAHLEELAVVMGIKAIHTFHCTWHHLTNLRALHVIAFRHDDTCLSVMRETRRFIIDIMVHHPSLKLEWIAMNDDDRVEHIVRKAPRTSPSSSSSSSSSSSTSSKNKNNAKKGKGKEKASADPPPLPLYSNGNPVFPPALSAFAPVPATTGEVVWDPDWESGSEEEDHEDGAGGGAAALFDSGENVPFYDVWGCKIFKKEVMTGRL